MRNGRTNKLKQRQHLKNQKPMRRRSKKTIKKKLNDSSRLLLIKKKRQKQLKKKELRILLKEFKTKRISLRPLL